MQPARREFSKLNGSNFHPLAVGLPAMSLEVLTRQTDAGVTVLAPSGRLDVAGAPSLKEAVTAAVKLVRSSKGDLRLAAPNQQVRVVLELTTLDRVFPYFATVEEALTDF